MLVLTRAEGESIRLGDDIYLTVVAIQGERVRVGITAPRGINIVRCELDPRPEDPQVKERK